MAERGGQSPGVADDAPGVRGLIPPRRAKGRRNGMFGGPVASCRLGLLITSRRPAQLIHHLDRLAGYVVAEEAGGS